MFEVQYVQITRRFRDWNETLPDRRVRGLLGRRASDMTWSTLVAPGARRLVALVAASGTGKTTEMLQQAARLRQARRLAVFADARAVADGGFVDALDKEEDAEAYRRWLAAPQTRAVFLIDGVDELVLSRKDIHSLVRRLREALDPRASWQLVLSARTGGWRNGLAKPLAARLLGEGGAPAHEVTFEALDLDAIKLLARAAGCTDTDAFVTAVESEEIELTLELRPMDVAPLASRWNRERRIGGWADVLEEFVETCVSASNPEIDADRRLTPRRARDAAKRVGAAAVLTKTPFTSLPAAPSSDTAVSARRLFDDWPLDELNEFFEVPLFVHKGADTVQLFQGPLPPFLAARWLADRLRHGRDVDWLRAQLMVQIHGEPEFVLPESRRETAGWLASACADFRKLLMVDYPEIVLYEGDPARLRDEEIVGALTSLLDRLDRDEPVPTATPGTLRKLARPAIEDSLLQITKERLGRPSTALLLEWAAAGGYASLIALALETALAATQPSEIRAFCVRLVSGNGSPAQRAAFRALRGCTDEHIRAELVRALVPDALSLEERIAFVADGGDHLFDYRLSEAARSLEVAVLDSMLAASKHVLHSSVDSDANQRQANVVIVLLTKRVRRGAPPCDDLVECLARLEARAEQGFSDMFNDQRRELSDLVDRDRALRQALWDRRLRSASSLEAYGAVSRAVFGARCDADLEWLLSFGRECPEARSAAEFALQGIFGAMDADGRRSLVEGSRISEDLRDHLRQLEDQRAQHTTREEEHDAVRLLDAERRRDENAAAVRPLATEIASGDNTRLLAWGFAQMRHRGGMRYGADLDHLAEAVGPDLVPVFFAGFKACWRKRSVDFRDPSASSIPNVTLAGLIGIGLEVAEGLDFASLSAEEATRASKYATYELNGLPKWMGDLLSAHLVAVGAVLKDAVASEWDSDTPEFGVLRYAPYESSSVGRVLGEIALELFERRLPKTRRVLAYALDSLLALDRALGRVRTAIASAVQSSARDDTALLGPLLRTWMHVGPLDAADWFEAYAHADRTRAEAVLGDVASLLDDDLAQRTLRLTNTSVLAPSSLERWIALIDMVRDSAERDEGAEPRWDSLDGLRSRFLDTLTRDPTLAARAALTRITSDPAFSPGHLAGRLLARQRSFAAEAAASPWTEEDILSAEDNDERPPRSLADLFALVRLHLRQVARILEDDEFSYRELFTKKTREREIQLWVASSLRQRARGLYSVLRENVVDDDKEVDITAVADGIGQVPIEIKPTASYSAKQLMRCVEDQLIGRYMTQRERVCGVLVLVAVTPRRVRVEGELVELPELVRHLEQRVGELRLRTGKQVAIEAIRVHPTGRKARTRARKKGRPNTGTIRRRSTSAERRRA